MKSLLAIAVLLGAATSAFAGLTVTLNGGAPTFGGGMYTYTYELTQSTSDEVRPTDFFTLFDFNGLVTSLGNAPVGPDTDWTASFVLVGANSPKVTFTYNGASNLTADNLGLFLVKSTVGPAVLPNILWQGTNLGTGDNQTIFSGSFTLGPVAGGSVPEPATMGLMGGALLGLGIFARRRRN
jgi:hypothetical protein